LLIILILYCFSAGDIVETYKKKIVTPKFLYQALESIDWGDCIPEIKERLTGTIYYITLHLKGFNNSID
jgi:hypothetical protein